MWMPFFKEKVPQVDGALCQESIDTRFEWFDKVLDFNNKISAMYKIFIHLYFRHSALKINTVALLRRYSSEKIRSANLIRLPA